MTFKRASEASNQVHNIFKELQFASDTTKVGSISNAKSNASTSIRHRSAPSAATSYQQGWMRLPRVYWKKLPVKDSCRLTCSNVSAKTTSRISFFSRIQNLVWTFETFRSLVTVHGLFQTRLLNPWTCQAWKALPAALHSNPWLLPSITMPTKQAATAWLKTWRADLANLKMTSILSTWRAKSCSRNWWQRKKSWKSRYT